jgi:hypothetical protein
MSLQASCQLPAEVQHNTVTQQLQLHSNRHKAKTQSKGSLSFGVWLGPTGNNLGRMREGAQHSMALDRCTSNFAAVSWSAKPCLECICQAAFQLNVIQPNALRDPLLLMSTSLQSLGIVNSLCDCSAVC